MINLAQEIVKCHNAGGKVLICGNGGLAAEAEHFTAELMGKFGKDVFVSCLSLTCPSALITALGNDYGYDEVFAHQIRTLGKQGDVLIAMTTSQSPNILKAIRAGKVNKLMVITLCSNWSEIPRNNIIRISGKDAVEVQNETIVFLHKVAKEVKELIGG